MSLFKTGNIILHSGNPSNFKIECDELTYADVETLCFLISRKFEFIGVHGVPTGGYKFAEGLQKYSDPMLDAPTLIVDDVLTTGKSMEEFVKIHKIKNAIGVVIFARGKCPKWITPVFQMWDL